MARTFEYVLHFVRCVTLTVLPNQIIIIIIIIIINPGLDSSSRKHKIDNYPLMTNVIQDLFRLVTFR